MKKSEMEEATYYRKVERDLFPLTLMKMKFEELISDFDLAKTEDLWDEETDQVVRAFFFEQGTSEHVLTLEPHGLIRGIHTNQFPSHLLFQIHNVVVGLQSGGWLVNGREGPH